MSVTFFVAQAPSSFTVECSCSTYVYPVELASYTDAALVQLTAVNGCADEYCNAYPMSVCLNFPFAEDVNVSNVNARAVLEVLGFDTSEDLCGSVSGSDFLGRVLTAMALNPVDTGVPALQQGNVVFCGRPEGYMDDVLARLLPMAEYANQNTLELAWG